MAPGDEPREFDFEADAEQAAMAAARRRGWADFYRVVGEPRTDIWDRPELLGGFDCEDEDTVTHVA